MELAILASRPTRLPFSPCSLTAVLILGLRSNFVFPASIVRRRPLWHAGAPGPGRSSKRFVGKAFPLEFAPFSKARFSFRETVAGHFGRAVKRNMRNVGAPESVARAGVLEVILRLQHLR